MKNVILDFGNVLVRPTTGKWFLTPKFYELIDINKLDMNLINNNMKNAAHNLNGIMFTLEEEIVGLTKFYNELLLNSGFEKYAKKLAEDFSKSSSKYELFSTVKDELELLSKHFKLYVLSDNWPCGERLMKEYGIDKYFEKIYISSHYDELKHNGLFFDRIIRECKLDPSKCAFVDDNVDILDVARDKGFKTFQMDRASVFKEGEHKLINNLYDLYSYIK